jgi:DNA (cytosine-5)-methyltransferase 1
LNVLNLYSGIGGNRKLLEGVSVTAVEINPLIAKIYQDYFPEDRMVIGDAHEYLLNHYSEYDFIWSSPPCPTHSITRFMQEKKVYPDLGLYQEILLLKNWFKGFWVVENVVPYYRPLIPPTIVMHRHSIWCNFNITNNNYPKMETCKKPEERKFLQKELGFNLDKYTGVDKRLLLRNCVLPEMGRDIFLCAANYIAIKGEQLGLL